MTIRENILHAFSLDKNGPDGAFYSVQDNAWMDQHKMIDWVEKVVKLWGLSSPKGIVPGRFLLMSFNVIGCGFNLTGRC